MFRRKVRYNFLLPAEKANAQYYPGEIIKGELHITSLSPPDLTGLELTLKGRAKVTLFSHEGKKLRIMYRTETYLETCKSVQNLERLAVESAVPQNTSVFAFEFFLRPGLPPSFWSPLGTNGHLSYWLQLNRVQAGRHSKLLKTEIVVAPYSSLAGIPSAREPITRELSRASHWFCCGADRNITVRIWLDRAGVFAGETVPFNAVIINNSQGHIRSSHITLKRYWTFRTAYKTENMQEKVATFRKITCGAIRPGETMTWSASNPQVALPPLLVPTGPPGCSSIVASYALTFTVVLGGMVHRMKLSLPILVGAPLPETVREQVEANTAAFLEVVNRAALRESLAAKAGKPHGKTSGGN